MLILRKDISWSIWQIMQYKAVCKDSCAIWVYNRAWKNPVLYLWLQFQGNATKTLDGPGFSSSLVSSGICWVAT